MESNRTKLNLNLLKSWPDVNPRREYVDDRLDLLGESIETTGLQQAIKVNHRRTRVGDQDVDEYLVIDGLSRVLAMRRQGMAGREVDVDLYEGLTRGDALDIVAASQATERLNVVEQADLMSRMHQEGRNYQYIANVYGCSPSMVLQRMQVYGLPDEVKALMIREKNPLPIHQALTLNQVRDYDQKIALAQAMAPESGPVMTEAQARDLVKDTTREPEPLLESQPTANSQHPTPKDKTSSLQEGAGQTDSDSPEYSMPEPAPSTGERKRPKEPGKTAMKNAAMVGVTRHEMVAEMTITGTWDISKAGVKCVDAAITFDTGLASGTFHQDSLMFDLGPHDVGPFMEIAAADAAESAKI